MTLTRFRGTKQTCQGKHLLLCLLILALAGCVAPAPLAPVAPTPLTAQIPTPELLSAQESTPIPTLEPTATAQVAQPTPTDEAPATAQTLGPLATVAEKLAAGDAALLNSGFSGAEASYRAALKADPASAAAHTGLSRTYYAQMGEQKRALDEAQLAIASDPDFAPGWVALAEVQAVLRLAADALVSAQQANKLADTANAQASLASAYLADLRFDEALAAARASVKRDPKSARAYAALAEVLLARRDLGRARAAAQEAVRLEPKFAPWLLLLGDIESQRGSGELAAAAYDRIFQIAPDFGYAQIGLAWRFAANGDAENAIRVLDELRAAHPKAIEPRLALAEVVRYTDGGGAAVGRYQEALRLDPSNINGRLGLAMAWYEDGDCKRAATELTSLQEKWPRDAEVSAALSNAQICLGDITAALKNVERATTLNPFSPTAWIALGEALLTDSQTDKAIDAYLRALRLAYADGRQHFAFGQIFYQAGDLKRAEQEYRRSAELWPSWAAPTQALCTVLLEQDRPAEARTACSAGYEADANTPEMARQYAEALLRSGKAEEALDVLTTMSDINNAQTKLVLGITYYLLKRYPEAAEALNRFMAWNPGAESEVASFVQALNEGYGISHEKAQQLAERGVPAALGRPVTITYHDEVGRTGLVVEVKGQAGEDPANIALAALKALSYMARIAPRMTPAVDGVHVQAVASDGETLFGAYAEVDILREQMTGLISTEQFLGKLDYELLDPRSDKQLWQEADVRELGQQVELVRGLPAVRPVPFRAITQAELRNEVTAQTDEDIVALRQDEAVLRLLGLIERDDDLAKLLAQSQSDTLLGYYDPKEQAFVYVTDKAPGAIEELTIAHEYVHALQDQHFTLALPTAQIDNDSRLALRALVEGDASLSTKLYADSALGFSDLLSTFSASPQLDNATLGRLPDALTEMLQFPYDAGTAFVGALYDQGGLQAIDNAFAAPPRSTEQILHANKYLAQEQPLSVKAPALPSALQGTWRVANSNALGELGWRMALQSKLEPMAANIGAAGWGGDRYTLFQKGETQTYMLAAISAWDTEADAQEFAELYTAGMNNQLAAEETSSDLFSDNPVRTWSHDGWYTGLARNEQQVALVIGPDAEAVQEMMTTLSQRLKP